MHPKVKASASVAGAIATLLVAVIALTGVQLDVASVTILVAAVLPVVAGYVKSA